MREENLVDLDDRQPFVERAVEGDDVLQAQAADVDLVTARLPDDLVGDLPDGFHEPRLLGRHVLALADAGPPGLDVGVDPGDPGLVGPEVPFDVAGHLVGLLEGQVVVDLHVEVHGELAAVVVNADVVDGHLVPLGHGPDAPGDRLPLPFPGVGVDDDVGAGRDLPDAGLDGVGDARGSVRTRGCGRPRR